MVKLTVMEKENSSAEASMAENADNKIFQEIVEEKQLFSRSISKDGVVVGEVAEGEEEDSVSAPPRDEMTTKSGEEAVGEFVIRIIRLFICIYMIYFILYDVFYIISYDIFILYDVFILYYVFYII
jgi:hypothetical protein